MKEAMQRWLARNDEAEEIIQEQKQNYILEQIAEREREESPDLVGYLDEDEQLELPDLKSPAKTQPHKKKMKKKPNFNALKDQLQRLNTANDKAEQIVIESNEEIELSARK